MAKGPKVEVSSADALFIEALKAFIEINFGEEDDTAPNIVESAVVSKTSTGKTSKRYTYGELVNLTLPDLRAVAKEAGCPSNRKAEILAWFKNQESGVLEDSNSESEEDVDEEESEEEEDGEEEEEEEEEEASDEESELRESLANLTSVGLRNRVRKSDDSLTKAALLKKSDEELIDMIVALELEQQEEDDEEEEEEEEETEKDDDDAIDLNELLDKKKWPIPKLLKFAEDNEVTIPAKVKGNRVAIVELLSDALGEDE